MVISVIAYGGNQSNDPSDGSAPPAHDDLTITFPDDGDVVDESTILVRGQAPAGAEIVWDRPFAQDDRTIANDAGRWELEVELEEGFNELVFRIGDDEDTERELRVTYRAEAGASVPGISEPPATPTPVPTPAPTPVPAFTEIVLSGNGDAVPTFSIPENTAAIARIIYNGGSNFAVFSVAADGSDNDLLVNEIGAYSGTVLFDELTGVHSVAFEVTASGPWSIRVQPVTSARAWNGTSVLSGGGDDVVRVVPFISGLTTVSIIYNGDSNFAVFSYGENSYDLLVNEIGAYSGEVLLADGTFLLEVTAHGPWSFTP